MFEGWGTVVRQRKGKVQRRTHNFVARQKCMYQAIVTEARGGIVDRVLSIWELAGGDAFAL